MGLEDFEFVQDLGAGQFAKVSKVRRRADGKSYALKRVNIKDMATDTLEDLLNEIRILASFRHPRIIRWFDTFVETENAELCIVMELCPFGDLQQKISRAKQRKRYIDEREIWVYCIQLLEGLQALHAKGVVHRDLKPANCLIDELGNVKIADMNISKVSKGGMMATQVGTPYFMSPEIYKGEAYSTTSDIWSLGCVIYSLAALKPPFAAQTMFKLANAVVKGSFDPIPSVYTPNLTAIVQKFLHVEPKDRPEATQALKDPIIESHKYLVRHQLDPNDPFENMELMGSIKVEFGRRGTETITLPIAAYDDEEDDGDDLSTPRTSSFILRRSQLEAPSLFPGAKDDESSDSSDEEDGPPSCLTLESPPHTLRPGDLGLAATVGKESAGTGGVGTAGAGAGGGGKGDEKQPSRVEREAGVSGGGRSGTGGALKGFESAEGGGEESRGKKQGCDKGSEGGVKPGVCVERGAEGVDEAKSGGAASTKQCEHGAGGGSSSARGEGRECAGVGNTGARDSGGSGVGVEGGSKTGGEATVSSSSSSSSSSIQGATTTDSGGGNGISGTIEIHEDIHSSACVGGTHTHAGTQTPTTHGPDAPPLLHTRSTGTQSSSATSMSGNSQVSTSSSSPSSPTGAPVPASPVHDRPSSSPSPHPQHPRRPSNKPPADHSPQPQSQPQSPQQQHEPQPPSLQGSTKSGSAHTLMVGTSSSSSSSSLGTKKEKDSKADPLTPSSNPASPTALFASSSSTFASASYASSSSSPTAAAITSSSTQLPQIALPGMSSPAQQHQQQRLASPSQAECTPRSGGTIRKTLESAQAEGAQAHNTTPRVSPSPRSVAPTAAGPASPSAIGGKAGALAPLTTGNATCKDVSGGNKQQQPDATVGRLSQVSPRLPAGSNPMSPSKTSRSFLGMILGRGS